MKTCTLCKKEKPETEFGKQAISPDGLRYRCKSCRNKLHREWRKQHLNEERKRARDYWKTPRGIYNMMKRKGAGRKKLVISIDEFVEWYNKQEKKCVYCGITEKQLKTITDSLNNKSKRLSIDRIDNSKDYCKGNLVLACIRCNYTKNDFFSFEEMVEIAQKYIAPKWNT